jgi:hypothetical protein
VEAEMSQGYWYCSNCREEIGGYNGTYQELHDSCGHPVIWIEPKPFYETPAQHKARTGKELSDGAQVWYRALPCKTDPNYTEWDIETFGYMKKMLPPEYRIMQVLIGGPEPPPDDWEEE